MYSVGISMSLSTEKTPKVRMHSYGRNLLLSPYSIGSGCSFRVTNESVSCTIVHLYRANIYAYKGEYRAVGVCGEDWEEEIERERERERESRRRKKVVVVMWWKRQLQVVNNVRAELFISKIKELFWHDVTMVF